jgi:hypothetical protein
MKTWSRFLALPLLIINVAAEPHKEYPKVDDSSYTEASGDRVIHLSAEVAATTNEVWRALTTSEGWKSFAVAFAVVDMQVGGIIETSYNPKAQLGEPDNIKNQIVAYAPGRILAFRCVQAPRNFEYKQEFFATSTIIEIIPVGPKQTRVALTGVGFRPGEAYDSLFQKFRWGNAYTLEKMRLRFESK